MQKEQTKKERAAELMEAIKNGETVRSKNGQTAIRLTDEGVVFSRGNTDGKPIDPDRAESQLSGWKKDALEALEVQTPESAQEQKARDERLQKDDSVEQATESKKEKLEIPEYPETDALPTDAKVEAGEFAFDGTKFTIKVEEAEDGTQTFIGFYDGVEIQDDRAHRVIRRRFRYQASKRRAGYTLDHSGSRLISIPDPKDESEDQTEDEAKDEDKAEATEDK